MNQRVRDLDDAYPLDDVVIDAASGRRKRQTDRTCIAASSAVQAGCPLAANGSEPVCASETTRHRRARQTRRQPWDTVRLTEEHGWLYLQKP